MLALDTFRCVMSVLRPALRTTRKGVIVRNRAILTGCPNQAAVLFTKNWVLSHCSLAIGPGLGIRGLT